MIKIGKYEFKDEQAASKKIDALGFDIDEDGVKYATHEHSVIELGYVVLEKGEYDEDYNEIKPPVLTEKYLVDVLWKGLEDHPYGWKTYAINLEEGNGVHSFYGIDYQKYKI